jgi:hypothetical protein
VLDAEGVYYFMPVSNGMGVMGVFDIVCCVNGFFLGVECKSDSKKQPTALQTRQALKALDANGFVFLAHADNIKALVYTVRQIKEIAYGTKQCSVWPVDSSTPVTERQATALGMSL